MYEFNEKVDFALNSEIEVDAVHFLHSEEDESSETSVNLEVEDIVDDVQTAWAGRSRGPQPKDASVTSKPSVSTDPSLGNYFREARQFTLLSPAEELEIGRRARDGDKEARTQLVLANLRLVARVARKFNGRGLDFEDLVQEGNFGLIRASQLFDPSKGARFSTYATMWIMQFISRGVDNHARSVRLPVNIQNDIRLVRRKIFHFNRIYGTEPNFSQIAQLTKLSDSRIGIAMENMQTCISLNQEAPGSTGVELGEKVAGSDGSDTEECAELYFTTKLLESLLVRLSEVERQVLIMHYGLYGREALGYTAISARMGLSTAVLRRALANGIKKMQRMTSKDLGFLHFRH
ncbi:MAG: sigma-70 family RNA polymerase sigma factor [Leptolyngbya sp.]|nr:sigma-70 family RNA polymerase sigma factor [Candidatus Melainabacteria bacterium]